METSVEGLSKPGSQNAQIEEVNIVCRLNQARSILSEQWLARIYPKLSVKSYGMEAELEVPIPKSVREISSRWGYDLSGVFSKNINVLTQEESSKALFIFAENEYSQWFRSKRWECRGNYSFQQLSLARDLVAVDPIDLHEGDAISLEVELAKAILCTSIVFHLVANKSALLSKIFFPNDVSAVLKTIHTAHEHEPGKAVFLDLDFNYNCYDKLAKISSIVEWNGTFADMINNVIPYLQSSSLQRHHISPSKEYVNPELLVLSEDFMESIRALTKLFPVIAMTGPLTVNGKQQVTTILSLALASTLVRVY